MADSSGTEESRAGASAASPPEQYPTLFSMIAGRARRTSDGALAACAAAGLIALGLLVAVRPRWGAILLPVVAVGGFGAWGIADRELASMVDVGARGHSFRALRVVRWIAAGAGTLAGIGSALWIMATLLGPFVS